MTKIFSCVIIFGLLNVCKGKYGFIIWEDNTAKISVVDHLYDIPVGYVAQATYNNAINETGWAFLEVHTSAAASDEKQAYSAGYLEGFLTRDLIWMHWQNMLRGYCFNKTEVCGLIEEFVDKNEVFLYKMIEKNPSDPYWYQIKLLYIQMEALAIGYNQATKDMHQWLTIRDIIWLNMIGDLDDLAASVSRPRVSPGDMLFGDHCSGLVKLVPDLSNLYTSQVTWNIYQSMLRIQKVYQLKYKMCPKCKQRIPGYKMSMSSYPGLVQSLDDFVIISSGLVAGETTILNTNQTLLELISPVGQVMEYVRGMVAHRLARDGREWTDIFRRYNSGTYNNQWFVVDYKKFIAKTESSSGVVLPGLLWVLEQLPGHTEAADLTELLKDQTYFASYNIAYFPNIFNISGGNERVRTYGDWFGYYTNPRGRIFKEKQEGIRSISDMFMVMRYNDYKHDPLARCDKCVPPYNACNAIASRSDLNPANGTYPFMALGHRNHGAIDAKVTSAFLRHSYQFLSISGPTRNVSRGIPPFVWSNFDMGKDILHVGHPDVWVFPPVLHDWDWGLGTL